MTTTGAQKSWDTHYFVTMITAMAEAWYVGQLGTESLAGLALAFPMMMLVMMLSAGSFGGTITGAVARRLGAGDRRGAEVLAFHAGKSRDIRYRKSRDIRY